MILDNTNAAKIAAHFGNKFKVVSYVGCWNKDSVTFALYQDKTESAGIELTIKRPEGDYLTAVNVLNVRRLHSYSYNDRNCRYERVKLPILKTA